MQLKWQNMLNLLVSAAFLASGAPVQAVEVQIQQDINFRQMRSGHQVLGVLKAGSIVDVALADGQRQNHPNPNHPGFDAFDLRKTLQAILSNPASGQVAYKSINGANVPLFKVSVVKKAAGSSYSAGVGSDTMIALDYLASRGKTYVNNGESAQVQTTEDAPVYSTNTGFDDSTESTALTTDCPDGSCNRQGGAISEDRLAQLAQLGSMTTAPEDQSFDEGHEQADQADEPEARGLQGFRPIGQCNRFIGTDGSYGDYGRMALADIRQHPAFANHTTPFTSICSNYLTFSAAEREHFQVWVLASLSAHEAGGCQERVPNHGAPHGVAVGLLQMEGSAYQRLTRANRPRPYCSGDDTTMYHAANNLSCGIAIMDRGLVSPNKSLYDPSTSNNYWRDLISPGLTHNLIDSYQRCGNLTTRQYAALNSRTSTHRSHRRHRSRKH